MPQAFFSGLRIFLIPLFLSASAFALDPGKSIEQHVLAHWTTEDGLPQNSVNAILQTRDGYLWLATFGGLARFDGVRFTIFDTAQFPGLSSNRLTSLLEDRHGVLWIGSEDGKIIRRLPSGIFESLDLPEEADIGSFWDLHEDDKGRLWFAALRTLLVLHPQEDEFRVIDPALLPHGAVGLDQDDLGRLLVGGRFGWARLEEDETWSVFDLSTRDPALYWIHSFDVQEDSLHLGTTAGVVRVHESVAGSVSVEELDLIELDGSLPIGKMLRDRQGSLWLSRRGRILRFMPNEVPGSADQDLGEPEILSGVGRLRTLYEDREGNLWVGSDGGGLYRLHDGPFAGFAAAQGFTDAGAVPILETSKGELWVGTICDGFYRSLPDLPRERRFDRFPTPVWLNCAHSMLEDRNGRLWLGGSGLAVYDGERLEELFQIGDPKSPENVSTIFQDHEGAVWVGLMGRGLRVFQPREGVAPRAWEGRRRTREADGLVDDDVRFLTEDRAGNLWIGTHRGMSRLDRERRVFENFTLADGLPHGFVRAIHEDHRGILWIGTYGGGLARFVGGRMTTVYSTANGLPENIVSRILQDGDDLWLAGNRGITQTGLDELERYAAGDIDRIHAVLYGRGDGMFTSETNGGFQPAGWRAKDGRLWFPTVRGITAVDPSRLRSSAPPPLHIEHLLVDQEEVALPESGATLRVVPGLRGERHLEIRYTGVRLALAKEVQFRHRLRGFVDDWIPAGSRRAAFYSAVPPGKYAFEVSVAAYRGGVWSDPEVLLVDLRPHWWQVRSLQLLLASVLFGGIGFLVFRFQARRLFLARERARELSEANLRMEDEISRRQEVEREHELVIRELEERSRELERFTYTVSHDLKSPVVTIRGFMGMIRSDLEKGRSERIEGDLQRIEKATDRMTLLLDELLELSRIGRQVNAPEDVDLGELAREALELVAGNVGKSGATVRIAEDFPHCPVDRSRMREVLQNLIDNAVRFMGDQSDPRVEVGWRRQEETTVFFVRDNGMGIDPAYHQKVFGLFERLESGVDGTGIGLALVRRIVEVHEGQIWVESAGLGKGSCFCFTLGAARPTSA